MSRETRHREQGAELISINVIVGTRPGVDEQGD